MFDYKHIPEELADLSKEEDAKEAEKTSKLFLKIIGDRINKNQPTIARLYSKNAGNHYVVIVGIRYVSINKEEMPDAYIINDPGRRNDKEKFTIDWQTRIYKNKNRKIIRLLFLDKK
ncbi:MAG: hypothetical protein FWF73_00110 [Spirochaetes bacterium]|nr:hypothetical protein [Spirochaetota bacterium]